MKVGTWVVSEEREGRVGQVVKVLDAEDVTVSWNDTCTTTDESVVTLTTMKV